jgi:hypothetical protein
MANQLGLVQVAGAAVLSVAVLHGCSSDAPQTGAHSDGTGGTGGAVETGGASGGGTGGASGGTGGTNGDTGGSSPSNGDASTAGSDGTAPDAPVIGTGNPMHRDVKLNTTATGAGITSTLSRYPVPVQLNKDNFDFNQAKADGSDVHFTGADGSPLPHEIELWDKASQMAAIWVKTTVQGNNDSQTLVMHWGDPAVPNTSNSKSVFPQEEDWVAVWHLGDDAAVTPDGFKDATGVNPGTGHNLEKGAARPGRMGLGTSLDHLKKQGVKVVENRKNFDLAIHITFEIWGFVRSFGYDKGYESYMTKGDESWRYMRSGKTSLTEICSDGNNPVCVFSNTNVQFGNWYHFAGVHDGRAVRLYVNGKREDAGNAGSDHGSFGDHPVTLGFSLHNMVEQRFMDMIIDEARFTKDSKTDDWIKLDYESVREGSTFVTFGPVSNGP